MPGGLKDHVRAGLGSLEESGDQETVPASLVGRPSTQDYRAEALSG